MGKIDEYSENNIYPIDISQKIMKPDAAPFSTFLHLRTWACS